MGINPNPLSTPVQHRQVPWTLIWSLSGVLALVVAGYVAGRVTWNWGLSGVTGHARLWAKAQRLASWAGMGSRAAETPREWSRRIGTAVAKPAEAEHLAQAFEESRYGRPDLQRIDDEEAATSYKGLRGALMAAVMRRKPAAANTPKTSSKTKSARPGK